MANWRTALTGEAARAANGSYAAGTLLDPTKLRKTMLAMGRVSAGIGGARVLCIGTSVTRGAGSSGTLEDSTNWSKSYPTLLATYLNGLGIPATAQALCADGGYQAATLPTKIDGRVTLGAGWSNAAGNTTRQTMGGCPYQNTTTTDSIDLAFTARTFDTVETYALKQTGVYTVAVDGGAVLATVDTSGSGFMKTTTSCALATHTVNIARVSGTVDLAGCFCYNSATPEVLVINAGIGGGVAINTPAQIGWTRTNSGGPYDWDRMAIGASQTWGLIAPDLTIVGLTINDADTQSSMAAYMTAMQTIITAALTYGDCILMVEPPSTPASIPLDRQQLYWDAVRSLAATNGINCVDFPARWGSRANVVAGYTDNYHPNGRLHADMARTLASALTL